jgi:PIN domain
MLARRPGFWTVRLHELAAAAGWLRYEIRQGSSPLTDRENELRTDLVFIDTEVFTREKLDWESKSLTKLAVLVKSGHLKVLTTSITKMEVKARIADSLTNAANALKKHDVVLRQLAQDVDIRDSALHDLVRKFDEYLMLVRAREVPLTADLTELFDAYFARKPPFSEKKKSEFPDAVVAASLRSYILGSRSAYVVSADPDWAECCDGEKLIHVNSIAEIISKATVARAIHDQLLSFVREHQYLDDVLREKLIGESVSMSSHGYHDGLTLLEGKVTDVRNITFESLNVLERKDNDYSCEIEIGAELEVDLKFEFEATKDGSIHYTVPNRSLSTWVQKWFTVEAEVRIDFDKPDEADIYSIYLYQPGIEIDFSDLPRWFRY